jgi:competence protein ComEC
MWKRIPFFRIFLAILSGIFLDAKFQPMLHSWMIVLAFFLSTAICLSSTNLTIKWKWGWILGACMIGILVTIGGTSNALRSNSDKIYPHIDASIVLLSITEGPKTTSASNRYLARVFRADPSRFAPLGKTYIYIKKTDDTSIQPGDVLLTTTIPQLLKKNTNPGAFDFFTYSKQNGICFTMLLEGPSQYIKIVQSAPRDKSWIYNVRRKILSIIRTHIENRQNAGLAQAMLIGYKEDLDKELLNAYTNTGVVHIIAISGLHLGLIFMLMDLLICTLAGRKRSAWAGIVISLPLLWSFAILTGSSASVIRSAIMFSFIIIGNAIRRKSNGMNSLLGSAFILLLWNPDLRFDLGFQLSYAAVASILLFDQDVKKMIFFKNKAALYCWSMVSITMAAQVLTTPIVIANFHRFPTLFLFTNLVAVPLSSLVLVLEIVLCIIHPLDTMAKGLGVAINALIQLMNDHVLLMEKIPFGMIDHIQISNTMMSLICFYAVAWYFLFKSPDKSVYVALVILGMALPVMHHMESIQTSKTNDIHVLNSFGAVTIIHRHGRYGVLTASSNLLDNKKKTNDLLRQTGIALGIEHWTIQSFPNEPVMISPLEANKTRSWVLLCHAKTISLDILKEEISKKTLILADASTPVWKIKQWEKEAQKLHLRFKSIPEEGPHTIRCHQTQ